MKAKIQSTDQIVEVNGVPARVWIGTTERGVPFELLITRVSVSRKEDASQFEEELKEQQVPHVSEMFPPRLVI